jgi:hypothetical protein
MDKYKEAYEEAKEAIQKFYRLTDEDNPHVTEFWKINTIIDMIYENQPKP